MVIDRRWACPVISGMPTPSLKPLPLYKALLDRFGPQGWWPTTPPGGTEPVYDPQQRNADLTERQRWEIIVGAVLTQNTAWRNVTMALQALAAAGVMDVSKVAGADLRRLTHLLRPARYYNQKARRLRDLARYILGRHAGRPSNLLAGELSDVRKRLLSLPGIGPETADSILLYADHRPIFVVDAYTRRIVERLGMAAGELSYDRLQRQFMDKLPADPDLFNQFHALLVRHAAEVCKTRPSCAACCLLSNCPMGGG